MSRGTRRLLALTVASPQRWVTGRLAPVAADSLRSIAAACAGVISGTPVPTVSAVSDTAPAFDASVSPPSTPALVTVTSPKARRSALAVSRLAMVIALTPSTPAD